MGAKILKIETYLPEKIVTNDDLASVFVSWSAEKIEKKTGIKERHIASENQTALDLAEIAGKRILDNIDKKKVDFLLLCTQSPDYYLPTSSCILQDRLGLKDTIGAFDFNLGCSGFVYGLAIAKSLICSNLAKNVLLITSETYSKHIHPEDKSNRTIFGDAAAATLVEYSDINQIFEFALGTDGSGYENLIVPNGGLKNRYNVNALVKEDDLGSKRTDNNLYMNGPAIFNFTIKAAPRVVNEVLKKNNMELDDLDFVIYHQANKYMLDYLRTKSKIPSNKFYQKMTYTGNTVSVTIPIALQDCINNGVINKGDKVLLVGFGVGYSWAATIIEI